MNKWLMVVTEDLAEDSRQALGEDGEKLSSIGQGRGDYIYTIHNLDAASESAGTSSDPGHWKRFGRCDIAQVSAWGPESSRDEIAQAALGLDVDVER
jgi:hypothetical protein